MRKRKRMLIARTLTGSRRLIARVSGLSPGVAPRAPRKSAVFWKKVRPIYDSPCDVASLIVILYPAQMSSSGYWLVIGFKNEQASQTGGLFVEIASTSTQ